MGIWDFLTADYATRQQRTRDLNDRLGGLLSYYLGPTGIPDRLSSANALLNPIDQMGEAGANTVVAFDPTRSRQDRIEAALNAGLGTITAAAPAIGGAIAGQPARRALMETIAGTSGQADVASSASRRSIGERAAQTYMVGQRLSAPSSYRSVAGKPSTVEMPSGEKFEARPISEIENAARKYMADRGMDTKGFDSYPPFSEERARMIAAAYDMMADDPTNPAVRRAYDAMVQETLDQYNALKDSGIEFKFLQEGMQDPYAASPALGYQDLVENGRLWVFPTDFGYGADTGADYFDATANPLLKRVGTIGDKQDAVANDAFRAVHDAFGHFGSGNPFFRRQGEERAFLEHSRMYSPEARGAMTSETRGQNSWLNSGPYGLLNRTANTGDTVFAEQKIGLMPSWTWEARGMPSPEEAGILQRYITGAGWK